MQCRASRAAARSARDDRGRISRVKHHRPRAGPTGRLGEEVEESVQTPRSIDCGQSSCLPQTLQCAPKRGSWSTVASGHPDPWGSGTSGTSGTVLVSGGGSGSPGWRVPEPVSVSGIGGLRLTWRFRRFRRFRLSGGRYRVQASRGVHGGNPATTCRRPSPWRADPVLPEQPRQATRVERLALKSDQGPRRCVQGDRIASVCSASASPNTSAGHQHPDPKRRLPVAATGQLDARVRARSGQTPPAASATARQRLPAVCRTVLDAGGMSARRRSVVGHRADPGGELVAKIIALRRGTAAETVRPVR